MRKLFVVFWVLTLCGCGSLRTVVKSNSEIGRDLVSHGSKCKATTRMYSGVTYDFCRFHAKPNQYSNNVFSELFILDALLISPIVDTVLLPVTIFQQVKYGNPKVSK